MEAPYQKMTNTVPRTHESVVPQNESHWLVFASSP